MEKPREKRKIYINFNKIKKLHSFEYEDPVKKFPAMRAVQDFVVYNNDIFISKSKEEGFIIDFELPYLERDTMVARAS